MLLKLKFKLSLAEYILVGINIISVYSLLLKYHSNNAPANWNPHPPRKGRGFDIEPVQKATISLPPEVRVQLKCPYP